VFCVFFAALQGGIAIRAIVFMVDGNSYLDSPAVLSVLFSVCEQRYSIATLGQEDNQERY
jgi:hypothetical protein